MKDLDFDELDRAVNSLIANTPVKDKVDNGEKVIEIGNQKEDSPTRESASIIKPAQRFATADSPSTVIAPSVSNPPTAVLEPVPTSVPASTAAQTPATNNPSLAGRRSSGQFMDVVHPSSDMRKTPTPNVSLLKPGVASATPTASPTPTPVENSQVKSEAADFGIASDESKPLESPFIPGTKVEKRPLGAFSSDESSNEVDDAEQIVKSESQKNASKPESHLENDLPAELQDELLKIESGDVEEEVKEQSKTSDPEPASDTTVIETASAPMPDSIVQQYKEHPSTGDQTSGSIYDTEAYHKALLKKSKGKSGWMWVVWIVLLVLLGAGGGAVAYFFLISPSI